MKTFFYSVFKETFDFLSSIKLAVLLLIGFAILLSWATIFESLHGTEEAQRVVYSAVWFDFLIFLLGVNVLCAALSRLPWKKRHTGFVITHSGIIIILIGSMITRKFGVEGQVILQEGEISQHMLLPEQIISISAPRLGHQAHFSPWFMRRGIPEGQAVRYRLADAGVDVYVEEYLGNPRQREIITNNNFLENPALRVSIQRPGEEQIMAQQWLFAEDPSRNSLDLGIASVNFTRVTNQAELAGLLEQPQERPPINPEVPQGTIHLRDALGHDIYALGVEDLAYQPQSFQLGGEQYQAVFMEYMPRAGILSGELVNKEDSSFNPVVRFKLHGPEGEEEHLTFALFPQFGSVHGDQAAPSGMQAVFEFPFEESMRGNRMEIYLDHGGVFHYRAVNESGNWATGTFTPGDSIDTTWNNLMLNVEEYYPRALATMDVYDAGMDIQPHNNPIIKARMLRGEHEAEAFIPFNNPRTVMVGDEPITLHFGQKRYPLGFSMQLLEFRAPRYPGTNRPASFESDVLLIAPKEGIQEQIRIHMNHPLYHNGFAVYQASYVEGEGDEPHISIFSVAYAPGTNVIYVGSIIMILGMTIMFTSRKYGRKRSLPAQPNTES